MTNTTVLSGLPNELDSRRTKDFVEAYLRNHLLNPDQNIRSHAQEVFLSGDLNDSNFIVFLKRSGLEADFRIALSRFLGLQSEEEKYSEVSKLIHEQSKTTRTILGDNTYIPSPRQALNRAYNNTTVDNNNEVPTEYGVERIYIAKVTFYRKFRGVKEMVTRKVVGLTKKELIDNILEMQQKLPPLPYMVGGRRINIPFKLYGGNDYGSKIAMIEGKFDSWVPDKVKPYLKTSPNLLALLGTIFFSATGVTHPTYSELKFTRK